MKKHTWVEVGAARSSSGAQIFKHSYLRHKTEDGSNFFILGEVFHLKLWTMKPYSRHGMDLKERVFNYRISRERRVVENAFGILTSHFRIFQRPMQQETPVVTRVVMACLVLYNLLRIRYLYALLWSLAVDLLLSWCICLSKCLLKVLL